ARNSGRTGRGGGRDTVRVEKAFGNEASARVDATGNLATLRSTGIGGAGDDSSAEEKKTATSSHSTAQNDCRAMAETHQEKRKEKKNLGSKNNFEDQKKEMDFLKKKISMLKK